ncbi:ThiF family adenylyltransferase [Natronococcus sp. A-GB1]|uniref:HesA/MoeB/ThiF family protein n=1 Tax=Natronococcus sp. A-GB1 TaxID=3037648 RepID=UPI00241F119F|nr:ThiF family adenylyltransferase [Natronococcus sp. A-GB1]MDG5760159.1 ThiF family adenylyltransferase [Natronococcus sp. A-GB1]
MADALDSAQRDRYSRQLLIDSIGEAEQRTLLTARVLVVGAGGLGSPVLQYLAASGIGTLGIIDDGTVKRSNLQRQVIHGVDDVGDPKVDSAAEAIEALNPDVTVEKHPIRADTDVIESLLERYDVVVDAVDNFPARFLVNDAAQLADVPFIHGAVYKYEGQMIAFLPGGPCYRCLLPSAPDPDVAPSGEPMGIFPTVPGTIGCLQATEVLKYLLDVGEVLDDQLLRYDATDATVTRTPLERDPECPVCGPDGIESLDGVDYSGCCRIEGKSR